MEANRAPSTGELGDAHTLLVTDLDGTLLGPDRRLAPACALALEALPARGVVRAVATGRSLHSARTVLAAGAPIDYLIFSSGTGAVRWGAPGGGAGVGAPGTGGDALLLAHGLDAADAGRAARQCAAAGMNVMLHAPVPDSHRFRYLQQHARADCTARRIAYYAGHCEAVAPGADGKPDWDAPASQVLGLPPPGDADAQHAALQRALPDLHVVRTTSPLDGQSLWLEVFARGVSKAHASAELAGMLGIDLARTFAVGNDYNDLDMLHWARHAAVVENAPPALREAFVTVASNAGAGVADAIRHFGL